MRRLSSLAAVLILLAWLGTACSLQAGAQVPDPGQVLPQLTAGAGEPTAPPEAAGQGPPDQVIMYATLALAGTAVLLAVLALSRRSKS